MRQRQPGELLTREDVQTALRGSYALTLEAAAQLNEPASQRAVLTKQDLPALEAWDRIIRAGAAWSQQIHRSPAKNIVVDEARKAIARRTGKRPAELQLDETKLVRWTAQQFGSAARRLTNDTSTISKSQATFA